MNNAASTLSLKFKLLAMVLVIAVLGAIAGAFGIYGMAKIQDESRQLSDVEMKGLDSARQAQLALIDVGRARANMMLATSASERAQRKQLFLKNAAAVETALADTAKVFYTDKGKAMLAETNSIVGTWKGRMAEFNTVIEAEPLQELKPETLKIDAALRAINQELNDSIDRLVQRKLENTAEAVQRANSTYSQMMTVTIVLLVIALIVGVLLGWWIGGGIQRQLGGEPDYAVEVVRRVANGDLSQPISVANGDVHSLLAAMSQMQQKLAETVAVVRQNAESVATASSQIAQGTGDLSARTSEQASALEETAASIEELTSTVHQNTESARQANQLASTASEVAAKGGSVVSQVVDTMSGINTSSKKIVDIISVIDEIAFQTNLLALNAAVEAARAGEQGRGFAVVASEVRNLAQRSASAAKEIKALITDSVSRVEDGTQLVENARATMNEVVSAIEKVSKVVVEISAASAEQNSGVGQISQAINQIDEVAQQNAALVEQSAAAAENLQSQAETLVNAVAEFKLSGVSAAKQLMPTSSDHSTPSVERRGPNRAKNVTRPNFKAPATYKKTGTNDWQSF
jgi:methyl-accepting chemotaxis protein